MNSSCMTIVILDFGYHLQKSKQGGKRKGEEGRRRGGRIREEGRRKREGGYELSHV